MVYMAFSSFLGKRGCKWWDYSWIAALKIRDRTTESNFWLKFLQVPYSMWHHSVGVALNLGWSEVSGIPRRFCWIPERSEGLLGADWTLWIWAWWRQPFQGQQIQVVWSGLRSVLPACKAAPTSMGWQGPMQQRDFVLANERILGEMQFFTNFKCKKLKTDQFR